VWLCQPRNDPFRGLEGLEAWRKEHTDALVVVDQFEELFTVNDEKTQGRFAEHLSDLSRSGVHVLLSMRDDFLIRCHAYPPLEPVFKDVTPVLPLEGAALRKALVEPARASGYRFEDEALVAEILTEVSREKGALPLLAFAASKLWEKRDREGRRLTREAYLSIGRVGGALAQHAEETLSRIGLGQEPVVREIFRNLTTASGTRVPIECDELLSVFEDRERAAVVLSRLIDARLLTSSEGMVELIHESLLTEWPRVVRWSAQDADGAVLRDQLRQAARAWEERGRPEDLLWTGNSYRELALWKTRHGSALTTTEAHFAAATARLAARKRMGRRLAYATLLAAAFAAAILTSSFWRRAEREALRAEASKLLVLGQLDLESNPSGALAYAIKSLETADTEEARLFALRLHTNTQPAIWTPRDGRDGMESVTLGFSPNGEWAAFGSFRKVHLRHRDGGESIEFRGGYPTAGLHAAELGFAPDAGLLASNRRGDLRVWSVPGGREVWREELEEGPSRLFVRGERIFTSTTVGARQILRWSPFEEPNSRLIGSVDALRVHDGDPARGTDVNPRGTELAYALGRSVFLLPLEDLSRAPVLVAEHPADVLGVAFHPDGTRLAVSDESGEIRIWATSGRGERPLRVLAVPDATDILGFSPDGRWLAAAGAAESLRINRVARLWDLSSPPGTSHLPVPGPLASFAFEPSGRWLVTTHADTVMFSSLRETHPHVIEEAGVPDVVFTPDGKTLLSASSDRLQALPLDPDNGSEARVLRRSLSYVPRITLDPSGRNVIAPSASGDILVVPLDGGAARELEGFSEGVTVIAVAVSPDGELVAAAPLSSSAESKRIRIWDAETGAARAELPVPGAGEGEQGGVLDLFFVDREHLLAGGYSGLMLFDLKDGSRQDVLRSPVYSFAFSRAGRFGFFAATEGSLVRFTLDGGVSTSLSHPGLASGIKFNREETLMATAGSDGIVRVISLSGSEPHLLLGHEGGVRTVAFSPDGRWLASGSHDGTIRIWLVPDVNKTPLHKRSRGDFLAALRARTNVRAVRDPTDPTGWKLEIGPFPGWKQLPAL
jgi:WD40 repeat protein